MPRKNFPKHRQQRGAQRKENTMARSGAGKSGREQQQSDSLSISTMSIQKIFSQTEFIKDISRKSKSMRIFQILCLTVATASIGALIAKLVPEAAVNNASNGVYIAGLVLILFIETVYQWGIRAAILAFEAGFLVYFQIESPRTNTAEVNSAIKSGRELNEERLKGVLEPVERVGLLAIGIMTHLVASETTNGNQTHAWASTLANDWAITLLLGLAGLLWQLKNQDNISTLTSDTRVERLLGVIGNKLVFIVVLVQVIGSVIILVFAYFPWGLLCIPLLAAGIIWVAKNHFKNLMSALK